MSTQNKIIACILFSICMTATKEVGAAVTANHATHELDALVNNLKKS